MGALYTGAARRSGIHGRTSKSRSRRGRQLPLLLEQRPVHGSIVDVFSVPDPENVDQDLVLNDLVNDAVIPPPSVPPIPAEIARQGHDGRLSAVDHDGLPHDEARILAREENTQMRDIGRI